MELLWTLFCGSSDCTSNELCNRKFMSIIHPSSCFNHASVVCFNLLLQAFLVYNFICKLISKKGDIPARNKPFLFVQKLSAVFNGCLGLVYIGYGIGVLGQRLGSKHSISPIHWWILFLFHGVTWLLLGLTSLTGKIFPRVQLQSLSILAFLYAGIFCFLALFTVTVNHKITVKGVLDILSFIGVNLLLLCIPDEEDNDSNNINSAAQVTPFSKAGLLSKISFFWLNPLMKLGKDKTLTEDDVPKLRNIDTAEFCFSQYLDRLNTHNRQGKPISESSIFWTIIGCYWKEILLSAFFAFLKTTTLSAGPIFLYCFIQIAEGKEAFRYEGCVLALALLISKILESVSQRQWFFQSRLVGIRVRSMLTAAIYKKQLKLSNVAKGEHSSGKITNYVTVDAYRIGEFPFWFHQTWTTVLQLCFALVIMVYSVGLATIAALSVIILTMICNTPLAKLQQKFQRKLMSAQDERLKACSEALVNMKVLKLYAWETHFKGVTESLREVEYKWLSAVQLQKAFNFFLFWSSPVLVSFATFGACYFFHVPLHASNVFTFLATSTLLQQPIRVIPNVIEVVIHARLSFVRIVKFLTAPELQIEKVRKTSNMARSINHAIVMKSANLSWESDLSKPTLRNINLDVCCGEKVAICGEVGAGKSTLLAAILREVPYVEGTVEAYGRMAYVSQTAWIQSGTIRENILFGSEMDDLRYREALRTCSLVKDLELLQYGDMTEIGERGINLSGGQKQRIQLARALYQNADIYLLDDPFSAVDAHTATSILNDYVMEALSEKTVLLVTHQVDFLPAFQCCLLMSDGGILHAGPYYELLASSQEFSELVNAHKETAGTENMAEVSPYEIHNCSTEEIKRFNIENHHQELKRDQLIKQEERDVGDTGLKPYIIYLMQNKGYLYLTIFVISHLVFVASLVLQNIWIASSVDNPHISKSKMILVYVAIGFSGILFLLIRSLVIVKLGMESSKSLFSQLLNSLYRAPVSFYDCTPLGRILSRISSDLSIVDVDIPFSLQVTFGATVLAYTTLGVMAVITWQVIFVTIPVIYMVIRLQRYYLATAKELMRLNGTTNSMLVNHLAESVAGAVTIRAFQEEDRFLAKNFNLTDTNASAYFHNFTATEWLILRIEILSSTVLAAAVLCIVLLPRGTFSSGFIGLVLSYGLTVNMSMFFSIQMQCTLANQIISVERLNQYMNIPSEAPDVIEDRRPPQNWPLVGKVEICNLQIRYRLDTPLVLQGITCTFEGGDNIGIVGRTGSGKTTLIGALFRLVEPVGGKIIVDGVDIGLIGLHDLRSHFGIIPQDPTLFKGTIRFNLDPLCQHNDEQLWEVLGKCQLTEVVKEKDKGLDSLVVEDGSNWSMGQRQLFCLGRALLRKSRVLVLDEATASIDNATDTILQKTIRTEFIDSTVITVAHRIPTVMDCSKVLALSDGKLMEFDEPMKLMKEENSLFGQLVKEYWSQIHSSDQIH